MQGGGVGGRGDGDGPGDGAGSGPLPHEAASGMLGSSHGTKGDVS